MHLYLSMRGLLGRNNLQSLVLPIRRSHRDYLIYNTVCEVKTLIGGKVNYAGRYSIGLASVLAVVIL